MKRPRHRTAAQALRAAALAAAWTVGGGAGAARAVDPPGPDSACAPAPDDAPAAIASVSDDLDVTLADGRVLRLAGIVPPRTTPAAPDGPARARTALAVWVAGASGREGPVLLRPLAPAPDRWGRVPALLFRAPASGPTAAISAADTSADASTSAAEALLRAGLARARPEPGVHACFPAFLRAEAAARAGRLGLWGDPHYAVLAAGDAAGLAGQAGDMALAEGVLHLHEGRGALYLALGRDRWGFAAVVSRRDAQRFARAGVDLHDYDGTPVRLRGDLDARFGPRMRLTEPDAIESLEPGSLPQGEEAEGSGADPKHWTGGAVNR